MGKGLAHLFLVKTGRNLCNHGLHASFYVSAPVAHRAAGCSVNGLRKFVSVIRSLLSLVNRCCVRYETQSKTFNDPFNHRVITVAWRVKLDSRWYSTVRFVRGAVGLADKVPSAYSACSAFSHFSACGFKSSISWLCE